MGAESTRSAELEPRRHWLGRVALCGLGSTASRASACSKEPARRIRFLTRAEAERLNEALSSHLQPVVRFALATGCRTSEILQLEWQRIDFGRRVAWLDAGSTKNGEARGIPLNNDAVLALRAVKGGRLRWCLTYRGKPMRAVGSAWERSLRRAGIEEFRFHDLRHTWASWHVMSRTPDLLVRSSIGLSDGVLNSIT